MKIVSWNINMDPMGSNNGDLFLRMDLIINSIKNLNADILLLQESSNFFLHELKKKLEYHLIISNQSHCGLISILIKPKDMIKLKNFDKIKNYAASINFDGFLIFNCHLSPYKFEKECRKNCLNHIIGDKRIIVGDMNMDDSEFFENEILKDIGLKENKLDSTWNLSFFKNGSNVRKRYDRLFTDFEVENFKVHNEFHGQSDHLPLSFDF